MKSDVQRKGCTKILRCIFCGQFPLHFSKVNPNDTVISYKNSPLKVLHNKLSLSGLADSDSKQSSDKRFPKSFSKYELIPTEIKEVNESNALNSVQSIPLNLNDTESSAENNEEFDYISKPINSANVSACGNLKFNRSSTSNLSSIHGSNAKLYKYFSSNKMSSSTQITNDKSNVCIDRALNNSNKKSYYGKVVNRNSITLSEFKRNQSNQQFKNGLNNSPFKSIKIEGISSNYFSNIKRASLKTKENKSQHYTVLMI